MSGASAAYLSYLLRLWQEGSGGQTWRASLESVASGEQRGFPGLDALFAYLGQETSSAQARGDSATYDGEEVIGQESTKSDEPARNGISAESNVSQEKENNR